MLYKHLTEKEEIGIKSSGKHHVDDKFFEMQQHGSSGRKTFCLFLVFLCLCSLKWASRISNLFVERGGAFSRDAGHIQMCHLV